MRRLSILLALLGLAAAACLVLRLDAADVWRATVSIGWRGAAILLLWQGLLYVLLGLAWHTVQPEIAAPVQVWGRMVRDAATASLPFSPVGGYVLGVRAVTLRGPAWTKAAAGTVADVTAELAGQLWFAVFGLVVLLLVRPESGLVVPVAVGSGLALALLVLGLRGRRRIGRLADALGRWLLGSAMSGSSERLEAELGVLFGRPARLLGAALLHLSGWFATGVATWISIRLMGHPVEIVPVLALEALLDAAVAATFVVPGAAGVQEAGYVGLGTLFGVPPDVALSVSLLRRAREVGLGLPILGVWQWQELRLL